MRLEVDFAGGIVFDPLKIWFDGLLRDSRVVFIALTGQFAFRAIFGDKPTFLISAGGFHPKFTDIPPGIPSPFQRIGADMSIGIVGMQFKGYFAVTSATVQGGSSMRVWADIGIASFEGGFEFDAIIYIVPKFHFEVDLHVFAGVHVFGIDFASIDIYGMFAGPGHWHIVGKAEVHTPWPLPDFSFHVDAEWGEDVATPVRKLQLAAELKLELEKVGNWSAQLPQAGEAFATFAKLPDDAGLLAHPNAVLQFVQKRMPLAKQLAKLGTDGIDGETEIEIDLISFGAIAKTADRKLDDSFSAGQFLKLSEDDAFAKPSFDRFEAGFEVGQRDYLFGVTASDLYDYEEVNLSTPSATSVLSFGGAHERGPRGVGAGAWRGGPLRPAPATEAQARGRAQDRRQPAAAADARSRRRHDDRRRARRQRRRTRTGRRSITRARAAPSCRSSKRSRRSRRSEPRDAQRESTHHGQQHRRRLSVHAVDAARPHGRADSARHAGRRRAAAGTRERADRRHPRRRERGHAHRSAADEPARARATSRRSTRDSSCAPTRSRTRATSSRTISRSSTSIRPTSRGC